MNFNSGAFLLYLPVTFAVHWLLPHRFRWMWLLAASWFFYMYFSPILIVLLLATTLVSYGAAVLMTRFPQRRKLCLTATLIVEHLRRHRARKPDAEHPAARGHFVLHFPDAFLRHRRLPRRLSGGNAFGLLCAIRRVLPAACRRAD